MGAMLTFSYLLLLVLATVRAVSGSSLVGDADCDCFLINGSNPTYYSQHMFFDFRNLSKYANVPDAITDPNDAASAPPSSDYFASDDWTGVWELQSWDNNAGGGKFSGDASLLMVNSPNNVYIQESGDDDNTDSNTFMTMRTKHLPSFQTAAEFESTSTDYLFLSIRMLARTIGSPGAVTAMFTYRDSATLADVQEADIEILTRGPRDRIQYTNQPSYTDDGDDIPEATSNASMPGALRWTDWAVHRLDWTPERSIWYVDGAEVANIEFQTPWDAAGINFNVWSDGGSWSGKMPKYDEAYQQIQWIEMVYNSTGSDERRRSETEPRGGLSEREDRDQCHAVCSIDETDETGSATLLWESSAAPGDDSCPMLWIWTLTAGATMLHWLI